MDYAGAHDHASRALEQCQQWTPDASLSPLERIDTTMHIDQAVERFALDRSKFKTVAGRPDPAQILTVPPELTESIEYAYVPSSFEYHAERRVSPPSQLYHLKLDDVARVLHAHRCHRRGWTGRDIIVAMADTGFAPHPHHELGGFAIDRHALESGDDPARDFVGHGTAGCADLLAIAPDCTLRAIKNTAPQDHAARAIELCLSFNPKVMVHSWGFPWDTAPFSATDPNKLEAADIETVLSRGAGTVIVFSGGNDGKKCFPASLPNVIAAGGVTVDEDGSLVASTIASSFSSALYPGRNVPDICGIVGEASPSAGQKSPRGHIMHPVPHGSRLEGENLAPPHRGKGWGIFSGTSSAAPQVAGVAALMLGIKPSLAPARIKEILLATARDVTGGSSSSGDAAGPGPDLATGVQPRRCAGLLRDGRPGVRTQQANRFCGRRCCGRSDRRVGRDAGYSRRPSGPKL
jgi:hypothetical protein